MGLLVNCIVKTYFEVLKITLNLVEFLRCWSNIEIKKSEGLYGTVRTYLIKKRDVLKNAVSEVLR
jgi:hypothetical protein